jgi:hypothetical protein
LARLSWLSFFDPAAECSSGARFQQVYAVKVFGKVIMDSVFEFLNQPIIITLITLIIGSFALNLITERRARQNKRRDEAVEFIRQAGNYIGEFVPHLYAQLRTRNIEWTPELDQALTDLFSIRMEIQVGSLAYLKSEQFYRKYFQLMDEIPVALAFYQALLQDRPSDQIISEIRERRRQIIQSWPLQDENMPSSAPDAIEELILLMDVILHRATNLVVANLDRVLSGKY